MDHEIKRSWQVDIFGELQVRDQLRDRKEISDSWTCYLGGKCKLPTELRKEGSRWAQIQHSLNAECWSDSCSAVEQCEGSFCKGIQPSVEDWTESRLQRAISGLTCSGIREIRRYPSQRAIKAKR